MLKRIFSLIVTAVLSATMLVGCSFFSHDTERDYQQVAAEIESYVITTDVVVSDGEDEFGNEKTHTEKKTHETDPVTIYKRDLVEYVNNNASTLTNQFGDDIEGMFKYAMRMLVSVEIVTNEVDALIAAGEIAWYDGAFDDYKGAFDPAGMPDAKDMPGKKDYTQYNSIKKRVYNVIDNSLLSIKNQILEERDRPTISQTGDGTLSEDTTYPVKPEEKNDGVIDIERWDSAKSHGVTVTDAQLSLEKEALRRFINVLRSRVENDFRVTDEDREKFAKDDELINGIIAKDGITAVYPVLGTTHYMYYISAKSIERSQKIAELQTYLTKNVTVSDEEVQTAYTNLLNEQLSSYNTAAKFDTAINGSDTILYYLNENYFYVKHILLPFSDEQTAALNEYKARINVTKDQINAYRDRLAESIIAYEHVDGENDLSRKLSVFDVLADIRAKMLPLESSVTEADRMFDDLIYKYNTDPGAFGNNKGYVVKYKLDKGESEKYMQEFADGARYMRDNLQVGQVYYEPVVTDYGVHIMYFASVAEVGIRSLTDYTTPGKLETYYDILKTPIQEKREGAVYEKWENNVLQYNYNAHSTLYEERYSDLWS